MNKKALAVLLAAMMLAQGVLSSCSDSDAPPSDGTGTDTVNTDTEEPDMENPVTTEKTEYTVDNLDLYSVPEWYRDAKFGIFIHYGVYSVPAFGDEWYGHWMYMSGTKSYGGSDIYSYHKKNYGGAAEFGYKDFIPDFLTELKTWDSTDAADEWAKLFSEAGAKYVVPVGIHHDSYALYDSDIQTTYNSVNQAGVDYVGELRDAVKKYGMKYGISNHFAENDWFFDDASGKGTDMADSAYSELYGTGGSKTESHIKKWYGITMEIIEKYEPDLIYFDFDLVDGAFNKYKDANRYLMLANYYDLAQTWEGNEGVVCNFKNGAFTQSEAVLNKEREALSKINPTPWQTDTSVGAKSWCYTTDEVYRSGEEFITALIDIVSKNGNLLLNVGPMADGTIPEDCANALRTIGEWLGKYGDAIYATRPWLVYGEGTTTNTGDNYSYTGNDIRFTRSKDLTKLYISALGTPVKNKMTVTTLKSGEWDASKVDKICLIDGDGRTELEWEQTEKGLIITVPKGITGAYSVEVTFKDGGTIPPLALSSADTTEAENFYEISDASLGSATEDGSDSVVSGTDGAYVKYYLDFDADKTGFLASVSGDSEGTITIRKDSPDGEKLGEVSVEKAKNGDYRSVNAAISSLSGKNTICLVMTGSIELNYFKFTSGKKINSVIEAEDFDVKFGSVQAETCAEGGQNLGYVAEGDYVMYYGVDFGDGASELYMRLAGTGQACQVRLDSKNGKVIARSGGINTGSWSTYKTFEYALKGITGVHDVYITFDTGWSSVNVNWIAFSDGSFEPEGGGSDVTGNADTKTKTAGVRYGAEYFDAKNGTVKSEPCTEGGENLGWVSSGDWVKYADFDFGGGVSSVTMRLAGYGAKIELRIDSADGDAIATFAPSTGGWSTYLDFTEEITSDVTGKHDLYIVFKNSVNVNWFEFAKK